MSCNCENKRMGRELGRIRRLAKALAKLNNETAVIYINTDGTYGFASISANMDNPIVEYITQY